MIFPSPVFGEVSASYADGGVVAGSAALPAVLFVAHHERDWSRALPAMTPSVAGYRDTSLEDGGGGMI